MKNKVNSIDFLILIYWVKMFYMLEKKDFKYDSLLMQVNSYALTNTNIDTTVHNIDDIMLDVYRIYKRIKYTEYVIDDTFYKDKFGVTKESMEEELNKFKSIFENIIYNNKFNNKDIIDIQKGILTEKMMSYVETEEYEKAAEIRDIISNC